MSAKGKRLDLVLEDKGYFNSRQQARAAIMDGGVIVNGIKLTKPGVHIKEDAKIEITKDWQNQKYVSRGGFKLEKALKNFVVDPSEKICIDIGASTGGFTDCLLQHGAKYVYAVDVGFGQMVWKLRQDERVRVFEKLNARKLSLDLLGLTSLNLFETNKFENKQENINEQKELPELAVIDVSFISALKILPALLNCMDRERMSIIVLIKPQFEAGPELISKGGVVKDPVVHKSVLNHFLKICISDELKLSCFGLDFSPLKGPEGNIEFLVLLSGRPDNFLVRQNRSPIQVETLSELIDTVVEMAHRYFSNF